MRNREDYTDEEWNRLCTENMSLSLLRYETNRLAVQYQFVSFGFNNEKSLGYTVHNSITHKADRIAINSDIDATVFSLTFHHDQTNNSLHLYGLYYL